MATAPTKTDRAEEGVATIVDQRGGGAEPPARVQGASVMTQQSEIPGTVAVEGGPLEHLLAVGGPEAPLPLASMRIRERDLVICDGGGLAHYLLLLGDSTARWEQRTVSYPPVAGLRAIRSHPDWPRWARRLCLDSQGARACRVPVGVVAAEARAAEEAGELHDGEEAVLRLSEATAAILQSSGKEAAKAGRLLMADVDRARRPSHVPLSRLQAALAEELALGHSPAALCSRSPGFSECADESKVVSLLCRRLGLEGTRDSHGRLRYARVAGAEVAALLCEALDLAPGQVGL
ncbi:MAG: hypothetical protein JST59_29700 [Actinobacteria bacterium]|nr:hypothetical protein [Actinomycetota bacterium]